MEDKIVFNVDNVDIEDIMKQIKVRIKERGYDEGELESLDNFASSPVQNIAIGGSNLNECRMSSEAYAEKSAANAYVQYWWTMEPQAGIKGKLSVFAKKVIRKLTFFYANHIMLQQNNFNTNTAAAVSSLVQTDFQLACDAQKTAEHVNELNTMIAAVKDELNDKFKKFADEANDRLLKAEWVIRRQQTEIDRLIENQSTLFKQINSNSACSGDNHSQYDFDYIRFEEKYRGSSEAIRATQMKYLRCFEGMENVVDIGCGRGEFLQLLSENGISAKGVDLVEKNVLQCCKNGLDAVVGDGLEYLFNCEDNSLGGIFSAQVIEHLSTEQLSTLLNLAHKKLAKGACVVLETLNPQCLMIYAESMYMDPSHSKPVHPLTLKFIAECQEFEDIQLVYMTPSDETLRLPLFPEHPEADRGIETLNNLIFGNREYALIARK